MQTVQFGHDGCHIKEHSKEYRQDFAKTLHELLFWNQQDEWDKDEQRPSPKVFSALIVAHTNSQF
jgi:hypothetical protein